MSETDIIRDLAKQVLMIPRRGSESDTFLWDRAQRLACSVEYICRLAELNKAVVQIDQFCLIAAVYFNDAGLAHHLKAEETIPRTVLLEANDAELLGLCAQITDENLGHVMDKARIKKINRIIAESYNNFTRMTEAMILSDARNLDDMGAVGILNEFRRYATSGKSISDALRAWERKIDYRYWESRLKKNFRFESVRKLAKRRLVAAKHFMNQLKMENNAQDLKEFITEPLQVK